MVRFQRYFCEKDRQDAIRKSKTHYMRYKSWVCDICDGYDYRLAGKWRHLLAQKHINNSIIHVMNTDNISNIDD